MEHVGVASILPTFFTLFAALLSYGFLSSSMAAPILAPDITDCHPPSDLPAGEPVFDCCAPPSSQPPLLFHPNHSPHAALRIRRPTHALGPHYAAKLNRAYELMKALPSSDPRSFLQQANIHCAYCNAVYRHRNTSVPFQVHESWLFFPFHRWYLYFHERILATLLEDDTFALAFWNYDNEIDSSIPSMFYEYPHLNDSLREETHFPPAVARLDGVDALSPCNCSASEQLAVNARIMHHVMFSGGRTASLFMGMPYRFGDDPKPGYGTAEWFPHNMVHFFVGKNTEIGLKDMGSFYAAARDPIFYTHHGNLDRLWEVWKGIEGHEEFDEPDFLDSEFVFYNEKAELVKVRVRDCLSTEKLGYTYEVVENTWINARPPPLSTPSSKSEALNTTFCKLTDDELLAEACMLLLDTEMGQDLEQILVIEGIRVHEGPVLAAGFHVFLNLPHANSSTTINCAEYAGSFQFSPFMMGSSSNPATLRLGIGSIVEELHLASEPNLMITIVPYGVLNSISVSGVRTEYERIAGVSSLALS